MELEKFKIPECDDDAVMVSFNPTTNRMRLEAVEIESDVKSPEEFEELRQTTKDKYRGLSGKKYAVAYFKIVETGILVTDFFRGAVLIDPKFYVRNMYDNHNVYTIVADEFSLSEMLNPDEWEKDTDLGLYGRLMMVLNTFWGKLGNMEWQISKEYFEKNVIKG
jgi:hypothetical protein